VLTPEAIFPRAESGPVDRRAAPIPHRGITERVAFAAEERGAGEIPRRGALALFVKPRVRRGRDSSASLISVNAARNARRASRCSGRLSLRAESNA
jgi:hypothetical protein